MSWLWWWWWWIHVLLLSPWPKYIYNILGMFWWQDSTMKDDHHNRNQHQKLEDDQKTYQDLRSRGLCLVPLSFTSYICSYNGNIWPQINYWSWTVIIVFSLSFFLFLKIILPQFETNIEKIGIYMTAHLTCLSLNFCHR